MAEFIKQDLSGSRFEDVYLTDARFHDIDLTRARFRLVDLTGVSVRGALLVDVELDGEVKNLVVNGIDVAPLVEAELDRRYPDRAKMRPTTADGFREAWDILERLWQQTVDRARQLPPELLHERVDHEWSFTETLRHLAFATDAWVGRAILGDPTPWHPLDLPFDEMSPQSQIPWDRDVRPSLDEVLALRTDRRETVALLLADLTDDRLAESTVPVPGDSWPPAQSFPVSECLSIVLNEEWQHRLYAERDLDLLARPLPKLG